MFEIRTFRGLGNILLVLVCVKAGAALATDLNNDFNSSLRPVDDFEVVYIKGGCGGVINNQDADINYKVGIPYGVNDRCVWTIVNTYYTELNLELTAAGFGDPGDFIEIYYRNPTDHDLSNYAQLLTQRGHSVNLQSPLVFIVFKSDHISSPGSGFTLAVRRHGTFFIPRDKYTGIALNTPQGFHNHRQHLSTYSPYTWITWTITPNALINPTLVIFQFNISSTAPPYPTDCYSGNTPILTIYQALSKNAKVVARLCWSLMSPMIIAYPSREPYLLVYQNGPNRYQYEGKDDKDIKIYWNMNQPPDDWNTIPSSSTANPCLPNSVMKYSGNFVHLCIVLLLAYSWSFLN